MKDALLVVIVIALCVASAFVSWGFLGSNQYCAYADTPAPAAVADTKPVTPDPAPQSEITPEAALANVEMVCDAFKGTKQEHVILQQSIEVLRGLIKKGTK